MKYFYRAFLFIAILLYSGTIICMKPSAPLTPLQIKNAQGFGTLPQGTLIHLASFCNPVDRCALRCTSRYLNQQIQGLNYPEELRTQDEQFINQNINERINEFRETIHRQTCSVLNNSFSIGKLCFWADCSFPIVFELYLVMDSIFNKKIANLPNMLNLRNPLGLLQAIHYGIVVSHFTASIFQHTDLSQPFPGLCQLLLQRPITYGYGLATHLYQRKSCVKKAQWCFKTRADYLSSDVNHEKLARRLRANMEFQESIQIGQQQMAQHYIIMPPAESRPTLLSKICTIGKRIGNFINPSPGSIIIDNAYTTLMRLHRTIYNSLPS